MATPVASPAGLRRKLVKNAGKQVLHGGIDRLIAQQSLVPDAPVLDAAHFPWAETFRAHWQSIRDELDAVLGDHEILPNFQDISPDQYRISPDSQWKTFVLYGFGERSALGAELCPRTVRALENIPGLTTAFFSILSPGKHIPRHRGVTKGLVRCHLGLRVPRKTERCVIEIDDVRCRWAEGELLFFDDTYPHEVWNDTDEARAVLFIDFERPLKPLGQRMLRTTMGLFKRTAYVRDAQRNQRDWEARYREHLARQGTRPA